MKARILTSLCIVTLVFGTTTASLAQEKKPSTVVKAADAVLVRPICFASTVVSSAVFVLSWPVAAALKKTKPMAETLVVHPAKATFTRPLGDMDAMAD
ncbi:MAG TPA: hypothetical protein VHI52_12570 [Verrucomicrobiae bacterium]|nr:hypothetical protein [Verrucomicrobiae bacterium]